MLIFKEVVDSLLPGDCLVERPVHIGKLSSLELPSSYDSVQSILRQLLVIFRGLSENCNVKILNIG